MKGLENLVFGEWRAKLQLSCPHPPTPHPALFVYSGDFVIHHKNSETPEKKKKIKEKIKEHGSIFSGFSRPRFVFFSFTLNSDSDAS